MQRRQQSFSLIIIVESPPQTDKKGKGEYDMKFDEIIYEKQKGVARIAINRPEKYNACTSLTLLELNQALTDAWVDNSVGVVVFTGTGEKAFCTGGDQSIRDKGGVCRHHRGTTGGSRLADRLQPDPHHPQAGHRKGERICHRRRSCLPGGLRPVNCSRNGQIGPGRSQTRRSPHRC
jgi:hypothetical protein